MSTQVLKRAKPRPLRDILVVALSLASAFFFVQTLIKDISRVDIGADRDIVGTLVSKKRVAQRRLVDSVIWSAIGAEEPVYSLDAIRTEQGSEAFIRLRDDTILVLGENSLVVLDFSGTDGTVDFLEGSILAKRDSAAGESSLTIRADGTSLDLAQATVDLSRSQDRSVAVNVSAGQVSVAGAAGSAVLDKSQTAAIGSGSLEVRAASFTLDQPANLSLLRIGGGSRTVSFAWQSSEPDDKVTLELSTKPDFLSRQSLDAAGNSAELELSPGTWYWRVRNERGAVSRASQFTLIPEDAPLPLSPATGQTIAVRGAGSFGLAWSALGQAKAYDFQIAADSAFTSPIQQGRTALAGVNSDRLPPGTYFWRVRAVYDYGSVTTSAWSDSRAVTLEPAAKPLVPEPGAPSDRFELSVFDTVRLIFSWAVVPDAAAYDLALWDATAGVSVPDQTYTRLKTAWYRPDRELQPGSWYWSVRTIDSAGESSDWSRPRLLAVSAVQAPSLSAPLDGYELESSGAANVTLAWQGYPEALVSVGRSPDLLAPIIALTGKANRATVELPGPGTYYWKASDPRGQGAADSPVRQIVVLSPLSVPELLAPAMAASLRILSGEQLDFRWKADPSVAYYRFSLRAATGTRPVFEQETREASVRVPSNVFETGQYSWSVQAVSTSPGGKLRSGIPAQASFSIQSLRMPNPVTPIAPARNSSLDGAQVRRNGIRFSWTASESGMVYGFELRRADGSLAHAVETRGTTVELADPGPGQYRWILNGLAADGARLAETATEFTVTRIRALDPVSVRAPASLQTLDVTNADYIRFEWGTVSGANAYELVLAEAAGGNPLFSRMVQGGAEYFYRELERMDVGDYIFTIRALQLNPDGTIERAGPLRSNRFSVSIETGGQPVLTTPKEVYVQTP